MRNWNEDPAQRTGTDLATWIMRVLVGVMWYQGMIWKLPLSTDNGLHYWMEQMAGRAAFEVHRDLVTNVYLPYFNVLNPIVFFTEFAFAVCLILGFGVRAATVAVLFSLHLWLGIYNDRGPAIPTSGRGPTSSRHDARDVRAPRRRSQPRARRHFSTAFRGRHGRALPRGLVGIGRSARFARHGLMAFGRGRSSAAGGANTARYPILPESFETLTCL